MWQACSPQEALLYPNNPLTRLIIHEQRENYSPAKPKLLDQVRSAIRVKHYSYRTEETYVNWIKRFILFHHKRHPQDMNSPEIEQFLTYLAVERTIPDLPGRRAKRGRLYPEPLH
jgi:hypothetical protein